MEYILLPFLAWCIAGGSKFMVNYFRFGSQAKQLIGYGGFPSTHTTVLSSVAFYLGLLRGFFTPEFSFALGTLLILIIDAHGLRKKVGEQAEIINVLAKQCNITMEKPLRERMGHTWTEIFGGLALGFVISYVYFCVC